MPLSDDEMHVLQDIEIHLADGYPRQNSVRRLHQERHLLRQTLLIGGGLLTGLLLVFIGLRLANAYGTGVGVLGGVIVMAAANLGIAMALPSARARHFRHASQRRPRVSTRSRRPEQQ